MMEKEEKRLLMSLLVESTNKLKKRGELLVQTKQNFFTTIWLSLSTPIGILLINEFLKLNLMIHLTIYLILFSGFLLLLNTFLSQSHRLQISIFNYVFRLANLIKIIQEKKEEKELGFAQRVELEIRLSEAQETLDFCRQISPRLREKEKKYDSKSL